MAGPAAMVPPCHGLYQARVCQLCEVGRRRRAVSAGRSQTVWSTQRQDDRRCQRGLHALAQTEKGFYSDRHSFETFFRYASADPTKPCTPDIKRYLMAHSSSIHARYGDWLVPNLKRAIETIPNPLDTLCQYA
jgi:hypothetical protein